LKQKNFVFALLLKFVHDFKKDNSLCIVKNEAVLKNFHSEKSFEKRKLSRIVKVAKGRHFLTFLQKFFNHENIKALSSPP
jgi:hypothetical protein